MKNKNNSDKEPQIRADVTDDSSLYGIDKGAAENPAELSEEMRRWQMPKEGMIEPSSDGKGYETRTDSAVEPVSEEIRRWQMPKEGQMNAPQQSTDLYGTRSADLPETPSEEARRWQMNASETITPTDGEAYSVNTRADQTLPPAPDMQVLFGDSHFSDSDIYTLNPPTAPSKPEEPKKEPIPTAEFDDESSSKADVYGVTEAGEQFFASDVLNPGRTYEDPDEDYQGIAGKGAAYEGEVSIDTIYGRRMERERTGLFRPNESTEKLEPIPEKSSLPRFPFFSRILRPFFSPSFMLRLFALSFAALVPFYAGIWYFSRNAEELSEFERTLPVEQIKQSDESSYQYLLSRPRVEKFLACVYEDRLTLFFVSLVWGAFAIPYFLQIFTATAMGDDKINEWPELSMWNGITHFLWLTMLVFCAGMPGWLLFRPFDLEELGFVTGTILLTPVFFLSNMEKDSFFTFVTPTVFRSLRSVWRYWRRFYLLSILIVLIETAGLGAILWDLVWQDEDGLFNVVTATFYAAVLCSVMPVLYLRFLGRLAWVIQEQMPQLKKNKSQNASLENSTPENGNSTEHTVSEKSSFSLPPNPRDSMRHLAMIPEEDEEEEQKENGLLARWRRLRSDE